MSAPSLADCTEASLETLCTRLAPALPARIVVETTGGLALPVAQALSAAGRAVARVNPRQVRDFGRALAIGPRRMRSMRCSRSGSSR